MYLIPYTTDYLCKLLQQISLRRLLEHVKGPLNIGSFGDREIDSDFRHVCF